MAGKQFQTRVDRCFVCLVVYVWLVPLYEAEAYLTSLFKHSNIQG